MARVFLSYDREDTPRARPIAQALEKAGHHVWWDRHIKGGAQYSKEIEQALNAADAVVVLWSEHSVESAWVRDEAAVGRDKGRLVPVRLDTTDPPLGFRQYQTIDLPHGRIRGAQNEALLGAIAAVDAPSPVPFTASRRRPFGGLSLVVIVAALLVVLTAAMALWWPRNRAAAVPTVAVVASDGSAEARSLAENLLVQLGSLQAADADSLQLVAPGSSAGADLTIKVGAVAGTADPRADVSLIDDRADSLLWSREFRQPGGTTGDLRQQIAYSIARVLRCATEAFSAEDQGVTGSVLRLYLNGCAELTALNLDTDLLVRTFRKVTHEAPRFVQGWAKLLTAEIESLKEGGFDDPVLRREVRRHIAEGRKLDPVMAEAYLAEGWLQRPRPIIGWLRFSDEAVARNPDHAGARESRSLALVHVGRMREAVEDARRAVQLEPLSPSSRQWLVHVLMDSGALDAARNELGEAERLWPGASNLIQTRGTLEFRYGNPVVALELLKSGKLGFSPTPSQLSILEARLRPSPATIGRALADSRSDFIAGRRSLSLHAQTLAQFGRKDDLAKLLLSADPSKAPGAITTFFQPEFAALHADPRFMRIAQRFGLVEFWVGTGRWPDFCARSDLPYDCKAEAAKFAG